MYFDIRERVIRAVMMDGDQHATRMPACPDWTVQGLVAQFVSMPMAIVAGDIPDPVTGGGDPNPWLARPVADNQLRTIPDLARWWASNDDALATAPEGAGPLLADLFTSDGSLYGAIVWTTHRNTPELDSQIDAAGAGLQKGITAAGLPPIAVDTAPSGASPPTARPDGRFRPGSGRPTGCSTAAARTRNSSTSPTRATGRSTSTSCTSTCRSPRRV